MFAWPAVGEAARKPQPRAYIWGGNGVAEKGGRLWIVCPNGCCARGEFEDLMDSMPKWWRYANAEEVKGHADRVHSAVQLRASVLEDGQLTAGRSDGEDVQ